MENSETLEDDDHHENPSYDNEEAPPQDFETLARAWLSTLTNSLTPSDVQSWLQSNDSSLPDHIKSMPSSDLYQMFLSFLNDNGTPSNEEKDPNHARFQRTDQWMPIYSWLESLKTDEVIKSKEIIDWLTENPEVRDDLSARHSRYHLMHYVKKCHMKILKRKEKKKGLHTTIKTSSPRAHKTEEKKSIVVLPSSSVIKLPKDSPIYMVKRNEAFRKYEILIEMEKQLTTMFENKEASANVLAGP